MGLAYHAVDGAATVVAAAAVVAVAVVAVVAVAGYCFEQRRLLCFLVYLFFGSHSATWDHFPTEMVSPPKVWTMNNAAGRGGEESATASRGWIASLNTRLVRWEKWEKYTSPSLPHGADQPPRIVATM